MIISNVIAMKKVSIFGKRLSLLIIIPLGLLIGMVAFLAANFISTQLTTSTQEQAGILPPVKIADLNLAKFTQSTHDKLNIYANPNADIETATLDFIISQLDSAPAANIYVERKLTTEKLFASYEKNYHLENIGIGVVSGNNIYLTREFGNSLNKPEVAISSLLAALAYTESYAEVEPMLLEFISAHKKYDLTAATSFTKYLEITQPANKTTWEVPYPKKLSEYTAKISFCADVTTAPQLWLCESAIFQSSNSELLPPANKEYFSSMSQQANYSTTLLKQNYQAELQAILTKLSLQKSKIAYEDWQLPLFSSANYQQKLKSDNYQGLNADLLASLETEIVAAGWGKTVTSDKKKDSQFESERYSISFNRENPLIKSELTLLVLDTATINADCIIQGIGFTFCDSNSLYKDSGYYIQLVIADHNRYK